MSEPNDGEELSSSEEGGDEDPNEAAIAWAEEIRSRVDDVRLGRVELIPGDVVHAEVAAFLASRRQG